MSSTSERLPDISSYYTPANWAKQLQRQENAKRAVQQARAYNKTISEADQETFYLAGMNKIAEKVGELVAARNPNMQELRANLEFLLKHKEHKIKAQKATVMLRHLELLESKRKALEALSKDTRLTDAEYFAKAREILTPTNLNADSRNRPDRPNRLGYNGHPTEEIRTIQLVEKNLAP